MRFTYATGERPLEGYTIKRGIGIGGFGQVYYAVSDAGKEVALKHILRNLDIELRGVGQCLNLKHPNLLALYDIRYDEAGEGWVVMEYIAGESLRGVLNRNPNGMPHDQVRSWLAGLAAGVGYLHDNGIVHRDLKPGNIFNDNGIIKVGDYGLSKFISVNRRSAQTESVGTFHYMAPEIGRGKYGREIDVYALGIILHEMLTGDVPFDGETSQEIIMKHLTAPPNLDNIAEPFRTVLGRALEKDPDKRLSCVAEMLSMLNMAPPAVGVISTIGGSSVPPVRTGVSEVPPPEEDKIKEKEVEALIIEEDLEETLYIEDDVKPQDEIELGPVEHRPNVAPGRHLPSRRQPPAPVVAPPPDEPIARGLFRAWRAITGWFSNPTASTPLKVVLLLLLVAVGVPVILLNSYWLAPLLVILGLVYAMYYAIRAVVISMRSEEEERHRRGLSDEDDVNVRRRWQEDARAEMAKRPKTQQAAELTGSLIVSAAVVAILAVVSMVISGELTGEVTNWGPQLAWFALTAVGGAWAVLVAGKVYAARQGDQIMRRLTMLAVGLGIGLFSFAAAYGFMLEMSFSSSIDELPIFASLYNSADHRPLLPAYLAFFGGMLFILRWWLQADPFRTVRFSLWATGLCALWGLILPFPQPWGVLLATTMAIAVQLAAPWVNKPDRNRMRQQFRLQDAHGVRRV